jgi:hypothetical protein
MAAYNKFNAFVEYLCDKVIDVFGSPPGDSFKVALSNTAPAATNSVLADITQISAGNGYTTGGNALVNPTSTRATGTVTFASDQVVFTASGGAMATFRYVVLYDDTPSGTPTDPLVAWWDHGSGVTLADTETFTIKFNNVASAGTIFTLA